jgi:hypothetical protein
VLLIRAYPRVVATGELIGRDEESDVVDSLVGHIADIGGSQSALRRLIRSAVKRYQDFVQLSRSSGLIQMKARLDEFFIAS